MNKIISIAIDAMGGDNSPDKTIEGVKFFLDKNSLKKDFVLNIFGKESQIIDKLKKYNIYSKDIIGATFTKGDSVGDIHTFCKELQYYMEKKFDFKVWPNKIVKTEEEVFWSNPRDHAISLKELKSQKM